MSTSRSEEHPLGLKVLTNSAFNPQAATLQGSSVKIEPLNSNHVNDLYEVLGGPQHASLWDYMLREPCTDYQTFQLYIEHRIASDNSLDLAILDTRTGKAIGLAALINIRPTDRVVEVGFLMFSPLLQRTKAATESMYLLARTVFEDLGYRRYEWKANNLHEASKRAALRLGFTFEGVFRQHMVLKGRNRDTAWFSMLDSEWPAVKRAFERWLDRENFDGEGKQLASLAALRDDKM